MSGRLEGRRAVVTGAAQGLGLAIARRFLSEGAKIVLADINEEEGKQALSAMEGVDKRAIFIRCDVARRSDIDKSIERCCSQWGGIDILVNNAGVALTGDILSLDDQTFDQVIAINLKSAFIGTQIAATKMIAQNTGGVIINMSSVNAVLTIPMLLAYNMSKGGINQLTKNTAVALAKHRIRVCAIGPGTIMTELTRKAVWSNETTRRSILSRTPIGRAGEPDEVAAVAAFLASDDASYITGETIYVDGGRMGLNYTVPVEV